MLRRNAYRAIFDARRLLPLRSAWEPEVFKGRGYSCMVRCTERRYFKGTGMKQWHLYIIRCDDRYLYTGISTDVQRRVAEHISGNRKAAKYTKSFSSIALAYEVLVGDRSMAAKIEYRIKKLPKRDKELIVSGRFGRDELIRYIGLSPAASSA